ncbi:hypothetical protein PPYR_07894 [Photinus pyralis]|uniref:Regulatory protein zeste n=1 Tax=Photinus pyralis TaxID=7054 RepID=A0A1Y1NPN3_PHOPY|nr:uncharacterized protein LOC116168784 [Photinus pyralis]XP_031340625.1 uncharacterized protein LOC116168784 [Photinus pyralis]XP_031341193.1 uncharacterized protein LOC116169277 [Photinus pyralis]XP_031341194.1 uncharacterized protein LOC116169277 [Photinus pyralis]KAB0798942.1 hypothetical protein PPYR_06822 [Photinus pyralis]KAB0800014.1 hypothetical protein PPYR_07894 [Photinus pyralis]
MSSDTRRERANNFTENEKDWLIKIVIENFFDIIESKKTDGATIKEKNEAWYSVSQMFNESKHCIVPRNVLQLRNAYHNMKKRLKKEFVTEDDKNRYISNLSRVSNIKGKFINMLYLNPEISVKNEFSYNTFKDSTVMDFVVEPSDAKELENQSVLILDPFLPIGSSSYNVQQASVNEGSQALSESNSTQNAAFSKRRKLCETYRNAERVRLSKRWQLKLEILKVKKYREDEKLEVDKLRKLQEEEKLKQEQLQTELLRMQLNKLQSEENQ